MKAENSEGRVNYLINVLAEELEKITYSPSDVEEKVVELLERLGLIEVDDEGIIRLTTTCKKLMIMSDKDSCQD